MSAAHACGHEVLVRRDDTQILLADHNGAGDRLWRFLQGSRVQGINS
jgi:hypothetical protein